MEGDQASGDEPDVDVPESERSYGTNLRIYDPESGDWQMAWISTGARRILTFTARVENGQIVMHARGLDPPRRNVFHAFAADTFSWRQEWSFDGGETWTPVAYLEATRVE